MLPVPLDHLHRQVPHNTGVFTNEGPDGGYQTFKSRGNDRTTFATALQKAGYRTAMTYKAIRTKTELYVEYANGQREYYNLKTDPAERTNTARNLPPQRLKQLRDTLHKLQTCQRAACQK